MTAQEMKEEFLVRYDAATSLAAPGWEDDEISHFLNIAQLRLVGELISLGSFKMLNSLVKEYSTAAIAHSSIPNGYTIDLTTNVTDYLHFITGKVKLTRTNPTITDAWVPSELLSSPSVATLFYVSSFNKPWFKYPKMFEENLATKRVLVALVDYYTNAVSNLGITYLSHPIEINIGTNTPTNMDLSTHNTIVAYAVEEALKSIKIAKVSNQ